MRIVVDPGHSGNPDAGAVSPSGIREADITLAVSQLLRGRLTDAGHNVLLTREGDDPATDSLEYRTSLANEWPADLFISIHCNSFSSAGPEGAETWYFGSSPEGKRLAERVQSVFIDSLRSVNRGAKANWDYYVLRNTNCTAILVEMGFLSNPKEEMLLASPAWQQRAAQAIANGIIGYVEAAAS